MALLVGATAASAQGSSSRVRINADQVLVIQGTNVFPIGLSLAPPPDSVAPSGRNGIEEVSLAGANFLRTGVVGKAWDEQGLEAEQRWQDTAARYGMHCYVFLRELGSLGPGETNKVILLRKLASRFRNHPGMGVWKGEDEPAWGKRPIEPMVRCRELLGEIDPDHPIAVTHAPRGTVELLSSYNRTADITGMDIYPVSYPPGIHSLGTNREISMVGDYTRMMMEVAGDRMPVWMILQIAWSGVIKPGKVLRLPTFPEERFMVYQAIIQGARGLFFFGGHLEKGWSAGDVKGRWNWSFWERVLAPVVREIGSKGPLYEALSAPNSGRMVKISGSAEVEFCLRKTGGRLFLLACKRGGATAQVHWSGLPENLREGEVLFEGQRTVTVKEGKFSDWFGPFEVHVYRFDLEKTQ